MAHKDPFLELGSLASFLWNEKKSLTFQHLTPKQAQRQIVKLQNIVNQIKTLDLDSEIKLLTDLYVTNKK